VRADQVTQVRGYADQMLRVKNNPTDPSNRRISILVKNDGGCAGAPPARCNALARLARRPEASRDGGGPRLEGAEAARLRKCAAGHPRLRRRRCKLWHTGSSVLRHPASTATEGPRCPGKAASRLLQMKAMLPGQRNSKPRQDPTGVLWSANRVYSGDQMTIVAGVDFWHTQRSRHSCRQPERAPLARIGVVPLHRRREDPDFATQSHADQMTAGRRDARRARHRAWTGRGRDCARHHRVERDSRGRGA
jgi:hypothetical protein